MSFDESSNILTLTEAVAGSFSISIILTDEFDLSSENVLQIDVLAIIGDEEEEIQETEEAAEEETAEEIQSTPSSLISAFTFTQSLNTFSPSETDSYSPEGEEEVEPRDLIQLNITKITANGEITIQYSEKLMGI